jgi:murein DD-endopeptidase MepM/ murein hydrolase activator NlpD
MMCPRRRRLAVGAVLPFAAMFASTACDRDPAGPPALPVVTITITPHQLTLPIGATLRLEATVSDPDGKTLADPAITWVSGAPDVATVSSTGVVTAVAAGTAAISAHSDAGVGLARVIVQEDFRLPLPAGRWLLRTEVGTPAAECAEEEGGRRRDGGRDCSHAGVSRYSLDFAAVTEEEGPLTGVRPVDVLAAADGRVIDICLLIAPQINCGINGPFVVVEHPGGFRTIYAHLNSASVMVRRKTEVTRGQPLGTMSASGAEPDAWVHFELRFQNQGAAAAPVLEALLVDRLKLGDYLVGENGARFYSSTNGVGDERPPAIAAPPSSGPAATWRPPRRAAAGDRTITIGR